MARRTAKLGHHSAPEYRIFLSYIGFMVVIVGLIVFGAQMRNIGSHYNVTPMIGVGMTGFGNQLVTTVLVTCRFHRIYPLHKHTY